MAKLEAAIPPKEENRFFFTTRADFSNREIIGFKYGTLEISRIINEDFEDFQSRASVVFADSNPKIPVFIIQSLYETDTD